MVRRFRAIASAVALVCALGVATGCVSSDEDAARTPTGAETAPNTALQTDADGNFVPAPGAEDETPPAAPPANGDLDGDVAAGETFFASGCGGCHMGGGLEGGGIGPQLSDQDLTPEEIEDVVVNGQGSMPAGLATGEDLTNVVAYVASLQ